MAAYTIWRSIDGATVLIRAADGSITLSAEDAAALGSELVPANPDRRITHKWTLEDDALVRRLYGEGKTSRQIATAVGCTANAARQRCSFLGLNSKCPAVSAARSKKAA